MRFMLVWRYLQLALAVAPSLCIAGSICGRVTSESDGTPVVSAVVQLVGLRNGSVTTGDGTFQINNISPGLHTLRCSMPSFITATATVQVHDSSETVIHDFVLGVPIVDSPPSVEEYHHALQARNSQKPVLFIHLDSLGFKEGLITFHASMTNTADMPIYILRVDQCIDPISAIVRDSTGMLIKRNMTGSDCVGEKIYPDTTDEILITPGQTLNYPPCTLESHNFTHLPPGIYSIALTYEFKKPDQLCCYSFSADYKTRYANIISVLTTVLRGRYTSSNELTIANH